MNERTTSLLTFHSSRLYFPNPFATPPSQLASHCWILHHYHINDVASKAFLKMKKVSEVGPLSNRYQNWLFRVNEMLVDNWIKEMKGKRERRKTDFEKTQSGESGKVQPLLRVFMFRRVFFTLVKCTHSTKCYEWFSPRTENESKLKKSSLEKGCGEGLKAEISNAEPLRRATQRNVLRRLIPSESKNMILMNISK